jgi:hypothetical protein
MLFKESDANNAHIKPGSIDLGLFEMKKRVMSGAFNGALYVHSLSGPLILKVFQQPSFEQRKSMFHHRMDHLKANIITEPYLQLSV